MYNFGDGERKVLRDFVIEGPEMTSSQGIITKDGQSGKKEYSIMCKFDQSNQTNAEFIETINKVHGGVAFILKQLKGAVKLYNFNADMPEATGLKNPVYRARDEVTGEPIQGRAPSMFLKLFSRGKPPMVEQTLFTDIMGKPIPWTLIQGVDVSFIPCIHVKRIYIGGGKASIQMEVLSAVVTSIRARNTTTKQTTTLRRLQDERPELADTVSAQLAKLSLDRQEQLLAQPATTTQTTQGTATSQVTQPTFAGITPQRQPNHNDTTMTTGNIPNIPTNMGDFTAGAPMRTGPMTSPQPLQLN